MLWLSGPLRLQWGPQALDLGLLDHQALPVHQLRTTSAIQREAPPTYWLIENRTSFERQARLHRDKVLIWMLGRPTHAGSSAMDHLLDQAPGLAPSAPTSTHPASPSSWRPASPGRAGSSPGRCRT